MKKLIVTFTDEEWGKLVKLAKRRRMKPEECLRVFVQACQPEGSEWRHPGYEKPKRPCA